MVAFTKWRPSRVRGAHERQQVPTVKAKTAGDT